MRRRFILLFHLYPFIASAQQNSSYTLRHIDHLDGLLHNQVFSITQDGKGFMWIGTSNGLQRFDGSRFVNFQSQLKNQDNTNFSVDNLYADSKNRVWLSSNGQLEKLEVLKNTFTSYTYQSILLDTTFKYITYKDAFDRPWIKGDFAIYSYDLKTKKMQPYTMDIGATTYNRSGNFVTDTSLEQTWVATWKGLLLFDNKTKKVYDKNSGFKHPLLSLDIKNGYSKIMIDRSHNIWITGWNNLLYRYNPFSKKIFTYSLSDIKRLHGMGRADEGVLLVNCIYQDNRENMWIGTQNAGLLKYNPQYDNFDHVTANAEDEQGFQYNYNIFCIFQDRDDNIWIGTDKGINIINCYHQNFQSIHHLQRNAFSISKSEIDAFIETDDGTILIGTWGGGIALCDSNLHFLKNLLSVGPVETNLVWSFIKNKDGKIWIGCQHGYLHIYDPSTKKIIQTLQPQVMEKSTIRCMQKDGKGNIYFGLHNGKIAEWDASLSAFLPYNTTARDSSLLTAPVINIFIDSKQDIWVGTNNGFKQFDPFHKKYSLICLPAINRKDRMSAQSVRGIEQYNDSSLLVGTVNGGLNLFNVKTKTFIPFVPKWSGSTIHSIKKDANNDFWITTDYALFKLKMPEKKLIAYNIDPGLMNASFESNNFYALHSGRWLTFTSTEVLAFSPEELTRQSNQTTKVTFTGFKIFGAPVFIDSLLAENKPVTLTYKQNFFTIEFAALDFSNIRQTKYFYRLTGIDKNWVSAEANNSASYTNLDEGNYTFSVKADEGDAKVQISSFRIIIAPPFWKTWWFITLVVLVAVLAAYYIVRKRIQMIRHEATLKHKIAETEMQALRAQMNPHFIFNCLNAIDNLIQTNQKDKATTYLARFAKLIRIVLESSKNNVVPFFKEYEALSLFLELEQFRCSNKFSYELKADQEIVQGDYKVPPLLIQPFIENAIHHGLMNKSGIDKQLSVEIKIEDDTIKYVISDNGVGRQKALEVKKLNRPDHTSYGIEITKERVGLYNKDSGEKSVTITDLYRNGSPAGTMVEVSINVNPIIR